MPSVKSTGFLRDTHYRVEDRGFETPCWVWLRGTNGKGYGTVNFAGRVLGAHRVAWILERGEPAEMRHVHHRCEVPLCINVEHLELVDPTDHAERHPRPSRKGIRSVPLPDAELTVIARNIRDRRHALNITQRDLANDLGIPDMTVSRWERGLNEPSTPHLRALAKRFECSLDDLLDERQPAA
jgi:DNA-binding XRE family transcriptional regulator